MSEICRVPEHVAFHLFFQEPPSTATTNSNSSGRISSTHNAHYTVANKLFQMLISALSIEHIDSVYYDAIVRTVINKNTNTLNTFSGNHSPRLDINKMLTNHITNSTATRNALAEAEQKALNASAQAVSAAVKTGKGSVSVRGQYKMPSVAVAG